MIPFSLRPGIGRCLAFVALVLPLMAAPASPAGAAGPPVGLEHGPAYQPGAPLAGRTASCPIPYIDIAGNPFYSYIVDLYCSNIVDGYPDDTFRPYADASRGTLVRWVVRARAWAIDTSGGPHFSDVPPTDPAYPYVETAFHHGLISGYADRSFRPTAPVTRGQMSKILVNAMGWRIDTIMGPVFRDVDEANPFWAQIETLYAHGVVSGYACGGACLEFRWGVSNTRGQLTKMLDNGLHPVPQAFGVEEPDIFWSVAQQGNLVTLLDRVQAAGLTQLRIFVQWSDAQPAPGQEGWSTDYLQRMGMALDLLQTRHVAPILMLGNVPAWARVQSTQVADLSHDPGRPWSYEWAVPPDSPASYGAAAGYLAGRFAGRVKAWEIWNEPDWFWNAPTGPDPARYTGMLQAAYSAIKGADPNAVVLGGSLGGHFASNGYAYLAGMYASGARGFFDALAVHPYCFPAPPGTPRSDHAWSFHDLPFVEQALTRLGDPGRPLWITEMGWPTSGVGSVDEATRAQDFRDAVALVRQWPYVQVFIAYYMDHDLDANGFGPDGFELWVNGMPTASWDAYRDEVIQGP